jgi:superfamily II DNA or RNA helicase
MKHLRILIGRHSFSVRCLTQEHVGVIETFNAQFRTFKKIYIKKNGRMTVKSVFDKDYIVRNDIMNEYFYTITTMQEFASFLRTCGVPMDDIEVINKDKPKRFKIELSTRPGFKLRDYQVRYVNTMSKNIKQNPTFLVDLQTGKGKSAIACYTIAQIGYRTAVLVKGQYIDKWTEDLMKYFDISLNDIFIVRGKDKLTELMEMNPESIPKFIIFSTKTMQTYVNAYEQTQLTEHFIFPVLPQNLLEHIRVSIVLVDETHKEFNSIYKTVLTLDPTLLIGLSATLLHNDKKIMKLYELLYPNELRLSYLELDKYAHVTAVNYRMNIDKYFKYLLGAHGYNQNEFELSIIKNHKLLYLFINMFLTYYDKVHLELERKHNVMKKSMLFFGSVQMCTIMTHVFKHVYVQRDVKRYVADDSYDDMITGDIIITTPGSSGEAIDIPGLATVFSAVATNSMQKNIQMLGRLREDPDVTVQYVYFYAADVPQHKAYHDNRADLYRDRVKKMSFTRYDFKSTVKYKFSVPPNLLKIQRKK